MPNEHAAGGVVLVTGATGFIGRHLVAQLVGTGTAVRVLTRAGSSENCFSPMSGFDIRRGDLTRAETLQGVCSGVETVLHLAGHAHDDDDGSEDGVDIHQRTTVAGTAALLAEAVRTGVRRFVFVSSVKAMGEGGESIQDEASPALPASNYGRAKKQAEDSVLAAGREHAMHASVLRLPLVYGRDSKGNLPRLIAAIAGRRVPSFPVVSNRRSMIHVDDVVQAILLAANDARANGQVYIVTDEQAVNSRELYEWIYQGLGKSVPPRPLPMAVWRALAQAGDVVQGLTGLRVPFSSDALEKLFGSACYSSEKIRRELGFRPRRDLRGAVAEMIDAYRGTPP